MVSAGYVRAALAYPQQAETLEDFWLRVSLPPDSVSATRGPSPTLRAIGGSLAAMNALTANP